jgi:hypothetical protein
MKPSQAHVSLPFFRNAFLRKYKLSPLQNYNQPAVVFGCSVPFIMKIKAPVVAVWAGSDALVLRSNPGYANNLNNRTDVKNIAISAFVHHSLHAAGVKSELIPVTPFTYSGFRLAPPGDSVYFYGSFNNEYLYGLDTFLELRQKAGNKYKFIFINNCNTYNHNEMQEIYRKCFCGLRLTRHDGLPNTVVELALMGRRSAWNGKIPTVQSFSGVKDLLNFIRSESANKESALQVREEMLNYININNSWMNI